MPKQHYIIARHLFFFFFFRLDKIDADATLKSESTVDKKDQHNKEDFTCMQSTTSFFYFAV